MSPSGPNIEKVCAICGSNTTALTASGDLGCLSCLLRMGAEEEPNSVKPADIPASFGVYVVKRHEDGSPHELGRGAMGVTFLAEDVSLQRLVALKVIKTDVAQTGEDARERFMREARAAASLRHPNVATVYHFGIREETGQCYCAMELIEGETLEGRVQRTGPLPIGSVREIARQIASALVLAEKHAVVHRDLKPSNVMITEGDEPDEIAIKIIDFGLAKALGESRDERLLTDSGGFLGTPAFASPEQLRRAPVDVRSDIFSFGVTLWFLLTGQLPFAEGARELPPVRQLKTAHVPASFISLLLAILMTEPAARPSAKEIARRLETRTHRGTFTLIAGAVILLGLLGGAFYFATSRPASVPAVEASGKSIAVLPFQNLSDEKGSAHFTDGMQDELLTRLAGIAELKVVSRTSVMLYRQGTPRDLRTIGRELGVAYVVEGAVQCVRNKVRISAQLVDTRSNLCQWAQSYDLPIDDVFAIQSEIAKTIAEQLGARIAPQEKTAIETAPTHDMIAFALYTQAKALLPETVFGSRGKGNLMRAAQLLGDVVGRDPHFLEAWCRLAGAHDTLYFVGFDRTPLRLELAESAVRTAIELQPDAGLTHLARARHLYQGYLAYEPALSELEMAQKSLPNSSAVFTLAAYIYRRQGRWEESNRKFENALALDPRNVEILKQQAISFKLQRRYAETAAVLDRALLIKPNDPELRVTRGLLELDWKANPRPMHAVIESLLAKTPASAPDIAGLWMFLSFCERNSTAVAQATAALGNNDFGNDAIQLPRVFWEGLAAKIRHDRTAAEKAFAAARAEQEAKVVAAPDFAPGFAMLGLMDAGLGRKEQAIEECRRAVEMLPVSRDPVIGAQLVEVGATVYAWTGEPQLACDQLEKALKIPGTLSYGQLRLSPMWDELRGNARFEKIVASLAPDADR